MGAAGLKFCEDKQMVGPTGDPAMEAQTFKGCWGGEEGEKLFI